MFPAGGGWIWEIGAPVVGIWSRSTILPVCSETLGGAPLFRCGSPPPRAEVMRELMRRRLRLRPAAPGAGGCVLTVPTLDLGSHGAASCIPGYSCVVEGSNRGALTTRMALCCKSRRSQAAAAQAPGAS